jgi:18S rRNA (guanine1575-N7)-methyltransferase
MITKQALRAGFSGGIIVDFPNSTRAKKMYLVIDAGAQEKQEIIMKTGLEDEVRDEE